jgi:GT2 family glycosyltransferase
VTGAGRPELVAVVVIVTYNSGDDTQRTLDALAGQTRRDFQIVVWDNASVDGAVDRLVLPDGARLVRSDVNLGFAEANNRAALMASSRYVVTLNPDAFPDPDWFERLVACAEDTDAESVASLQIAADDPERLDGAGDTLGIAGIAWRNGYRHPMDERPRERVEVFSACGAAALYRRDAFEAVGGFDERFFCYFEDVDLGFRLRLRGGSTVLEPAAVVHHVGSASSQKVSGFAEYHGTRNAVWTLGRDMPTVLLPLVIPVHVVFVLSRLAWPQPAAQRRARWCGWRAGVLGLGPFVRERRSWRPARAWSVARMLCWNPALTRHKTPVYRSIRRRRVPEGVVGPPVPGSIARRTDRTPASIAPMRTAEPT